MVRTQVLTVLQGLHYKTNNLYENLQLLQFNYINNYCYMKKIQLLNGIIFCFLTVEK